MAANRRNLRKRKDCLREYSEAGLIKRFRLERDGIQFVATMIGNEIRS
jgi:hypothetical protein